MENGFICVRGKVLDRVRWGLLNWMGAPKARLPQCINCLKWPCLASYNLILAENDEFFMTGEVVVRILLIDVRVVSLKSVLIIVFSYMTLNGLPDHDLLIFLQGDAVSFPYRSRLNSRQYSLD